MPKVVDNLAQGCDKLPQGCGKRPEGYQRSSGHLIKIEDNFVTLII